MTPATVSTVTECVSEPRRSQHHPAPSRKSDTGGMTVGPAQVIRAAIASARVRYPMSQHENSKIGQCGPPPGRYTKHSRRLACQRPWQCDWQCTHHHGVHDSCSMMQDGSMVCHTRLSEPVHLVHLSLWQCKIQWYQPKKHSL